MAVTICSRKWVAIVSVGWLFTLPLAGADPAWLVRAKGGMVASDSPEASQIGSDVLKAGGNAFDAAVATSFALAVARPESTGLGGGGFMVAYLAKEKRFVALDFREMAPKEATAEYYAKLAETKSEAPAPSICGGNAVAVPGQLAGLAEINKRFGTRPLAELIRPSITLADFGFAADGHYRDACQDALRDFDKWPPLRLRYAALYTSFLNTGKPPRVGERIKRLDFAKTLRLIAERGPDALYKGPIGEAIVNAVKRGGGVLAAEDLRAYRVREREPLRARTFGLNGDYEIVTMPPPSSGGACLIEALNIIHGTLVRSDLHPTADRPHVLVEALKHAFADRARWLGDPDFCEIPLQRLTSVEYGIELSRRIKLHQTHPAGDYGSTPPPPSDGGTSHFCVADKDGNVVTLTETINGTFGSYVVAEPYGIVLNNEMDDFTTNPGQANLFGLVQGAANAVAPGKRPLSSMTPTIVLKDGRPVLALGGSGGPRIITAVLQVLLNTIDQNMPLDQALDAVRLHHQWQPDEVYFDREPPADVVAALKECGHTISAKRKTAAVQAIQFLDDGTMVGACDPRKGGRPAGVP